MKSSLTQRLGIKYPIFQAPMAGGIVSPKFISQVSNFGMLGSFATGYLSLDKIVSSIEEIQKDTAASFSINIFVDYQEYTAKQRPKPDEIIQIEANLNLEVDPFYKIPPIPKVSDLVQIAIDLKVPAVSTVFGLLQEGEIVALKDSGVVIMTTINSVVEAKVALSSQKSDILIFQSKEAGGHKGGFTQSDYSEIDEIIAFQEENSTVDIVLAGGITCNKDISAVMALGFDGVQIGTAFIATKESTATEQYKEAIVNANGEKSTIFTQSITGRKAQGICNEFTRLELQDNPGFPYLHYATTSLRKQAKAKGIMAYQSLWAGSGVNNIHALSTLQNFMNSLTHNT